MAKEYNIQELTWFITAIKAYVNDLYPELEDVRTKSELLESQSEFDEDELEKLNDKEYRLDQKITAFNDLFYQLQEDYDVQYKKEFSDSPPPKLKLFDQQS